MMQVKRYMAPTFAEALIQAKNELGTDAVIVESKKIRVGGIFGFFGREMTELTVAVDTKPGQQRPPSAGRVPPPAPQPRSEAPPAANGPKSRPEAPPAPPAGNPASATRAAVRPDEGRPAAEAGIRNLEQEMVNLRVAVSRLLERDGAAAEGLHGFGRQVFDTLLARGVEEAAALELGQLCAEEEVAGRAILARELARLIGPTAPITVKKGQRKIIALVGPTGVGKTTTLAKLAAHFTFDKGINVGLITSDTFRIAAIAQLRTYADILGVTLYTVDRPEEAVHALKETMDKDIVLVDTGGRNFRDPTRMEELRELLAVVRPDETHLVFSLNTNPRDAFDALDAFLPLGVNRLTFTKLDETASPGLILNLKLRCEHPVGYLTHGQSVPDDIIPADQADFIKILMGA